MSPQSYNKFVATSTVPRTRRSVAYKAGAYAYMRVGGGWCLQLWSVFDDVISRRIHSL